MAENCHRSDSEGEEEIRVACGREVPVATHSAAPAADGHASRRGNRPRTPESEVQQMLTPCQLAQMAHSDWLDFAAGAQILAKYHAKY